MTTPRRRAPRLRRILRTVALMGALALLAGCGSSSAATPATVAPPDVAPAGVVVGGTQQTAAAADTTCNNGQPTASLPALTTLPAPGAMPAGTYMQTIENRGYLIAGVDQNTLLWGYRDPSTGQLSGFDIDMVDQVALAIFGSVTGRIHYQIVANAQRIPAVQSGQVDIVAETMTINCDREKSVDFSTVYYNAGQRILVPSNSTIKSSTDLGGKRVCAAAGSTSLVNLAALPVKPAVIPVAVVNQTDCLVMLQQGQVAAISTDDTILQGIAAQDPTVALVGAAFTDEPYGMAMNLAHPEFVSFVNGVLAAERTDGTWAAIYTKWLGKITGGVAPAPPVPVYRTTG